MKRACLAAVLGILLLSPLTASAQDAAACSLAGSWMAQTGSMLLLATYTDTTAGQTGTSDLEPYVYDASFGGYFPAARITSGRGAWTRLGQRTYGYTFVFIGLGADGAPVYQGKVSGVKRLSADCLTLEFTTSIAFYAADQDPVGTQQPAFGVVQGELGTAKRIVAPGVR